MIWLKQGPHAAGETHLFRIVPPSEGCNGMMNGFCQLVEVNLVQDGVIHGTLFADMPRAMKFQQKSGLALSGDGSFVVKVIIV
jgi:hypothetical protein